MQPDDLSPLDAVVLSHLHGDHFDRVAKRGLARTQPVISTPVAAGKLDCWGFEARGLGTWEKGDTLQVIQILERRLVALNTGEAQPSGGDPTAFAPETDKGVPGGSTASPANEGTSTEPAVPGRPDQPGTASTLTDHRRSGPYGSCTSAARRSTSRASSRRVRCPSGIARVIHTWNIAGFS